MGTDSVIKYIPKTNGEVSPQLQLLDQAVKDAKGQYVLFNEDVHSSAPLTPSQRYYLKKTMRLSMDVDMLRYLIP